ncbi:MAG: hypothetical protein K2X87_12380 [Gemmataceae bacterium]|nr:hypothetical protein [Gemmataceae bacterium]
MSKLGMPALAAAVALAGCAGPAPVPPATGTGREAAAQEKPPPVAIVQMPAVFGPEPPAAVPKGAAAVLVPIFEERNKLHQRQAGARLIISAEWGKHRGVVPVVGLDWTVDYVGPRRPFVILTPGMGTDVALAHFWYVTPNGKAAAVTWGWGGVIAGAQPHKRREWFSAAADGKPVAGRLETDGSYLAGKMGQRPRPGDPPLWVQLEYVATDRGDGFDWATDPATTRITLGPYWAFDAWTGRLWSPVVEVTVE